MIDGEDDGVTTLASTEDDLAVSMGAVRGVVDGEDDDTTTLISSEDDAGSVG